VSLPCRRPSHLTHLVTQNPDDASLLNSLQAITAWQEFLDHPRGPVLGLYTATLYLPSILTAYLGDFVSQHYGRRVALALGSFFVLVGSFVKALAVNPGMWIAGESLKFPACLLSHAEILQGRAIMGAGGGIAKVAAPALIQKVAHPRLRPMLASCYYPFFYFGALLSALLCCETCSTTLLHLTN
jgi:MFS family permease